MFNVVAKADIHQNQITKLLKQRGRIHSSLIYSCERMETLEQSFCAHIYALTDDESTDIKPEVGELIQVLTVIMNIVELKDGLTAESTNESAESECVITQLTNYYEKLRVNEDLAKAQALTLLCSMLPISYFTEKQHTLNEQFLENILYRNNPLYDLLIHFNIAWPAEKIQIARQSALVAQFVPSFTVACLLFSQNNVTALELAQGYSHQQFSIVKACFLTGIIQDKQNSQVALFNRFSQTTDPKEKAELLIIAGLTGDEKWNEPCVIFCQRHPEFTFNVLSAFQHKAFLMTVIELMGIAQTSEEAYEAWLLLTNCELQQKPQLQDTANPHISAGSSHIPDLQQAELIRQTLMQQSDLKVLNGITFSDSNALTKLAELQGIAVQYALIPAYSQHQGISLYCCQLSAQAFKVIHNITPEFKGANNAA